MRGTSTPVCSTHPDLCFTNKPVSDHKIACREQTIEELRVQLAQAEQKADLINRTHEQKHQCESLYYQGRIYDAAQSLLAPSDDVRGNTLIADWLAGEFRHRELGQHVFDSCR